MPHLNRKLLLVITLVSLWVVPVTCHAQDQLRLRDICRLKGQEENRIQGIGLVVGLKGTGDSELNPTTRTLARMIQSMGGNVAADVQGIPDFEELKDVANVALVLVTATIPKTGAQQGDQLDCSVSAFNAKSLEGGRLVAAYLLGPRSDDSRIYAIAGGNISIPEAAVPTSGMVYRGCKMEATVENQFVTDNKVTLIIDRDVASFSMATDIQDAIDQFNQAGISGGTTGDRVAAEAIGQSIVEVTVPDSYLEEAGGPVKFVALLLDIALPNVKKQKRVVINEREGVIVMGEGVLINPVVITHKNLSIEARPVSSGFVGIDIEAGDAKNIRPTLKNLVDALNALNVPTEDKIAIIRTLKRNGDLYGEVVFQ